MKKRIIGVGSLTLSASLVVSLSVPALADTDVAINWAEIGIYPRSTPDMNSDRSNQLLQNGDRITVSCEIVGRPVSNGAAAIDIWEKLSDGSYVPNAFVDMRADSWTPGVPRCDEIGLNDRPNALNGIQIHDDGNVANQLLNHYDGASGDPVVIDWAYFTENKESLVEVLRNIPVGKTNGVTTELGVEGPDMVTAIGHFDATRYSERCFLIEGVYDFSPDTPYFSLWLDGVTGAAKSFKVQSSGCL